MWLKFVLRNRRTSEIMIFNTALKNIHFRNTMFIFLLWATFSLHFADVVPNVQSNLNTFENIYFGMLKEDNFENKTQSNGVEYFTRNVMRKALPIIINISDRISMTEKCKASLVKYVDGLINMKYWALEMFDSTSKPPSGLLGGTRSELGSFDQCLGVELLHPDGRKEFAGQYCAVEVGKIQLTNPFHSERERKNQSMDAIEQYSKKLGHDNFKFLLGICVPSQCSQQDMSEIFSKVAKKFQMEIRVPKCYVKRPVMLKSVHIITIVSVCFLLLLGIFGSILENRLKKMTPTKKTMNRYRDVFACFSLISNYRKLVTIPKISDKFNALTGMRGLTIGWVMLGQNYAWTDFLLARRPKQLNYALQKLQFGMIVNSWLSVEPFFVISGVLTSFSVLRHLHASKGRINVPFFILRRYFRNLLLLLLTMGLAFVMPIVSSGPFWYAEVDAELDNCVQRWWAGILFISNWFSMKEICISPASWYISADLQLHAVSLIFLYPLYRCPKFGVPLVVCATAACCMAVGAVTYTKDLPPTIQMSSSDKQKVQDTIDLVHLRPFTHAGPYFVGVLVGYVLSKNHSTRMGKVRNWLGWLLSTAMALTALYGAHIWGGPLMTSVFAAAHRTTFSMAVAWVIFVCVTGNGGFVHSVLSSSLLVVLGRLTFMVFLFHSLVFWTRKGSSRERTFLSLYNLLYEYIGSVFLTLVLSLPCHLLLEAPITRLDALLFPEKTEEKHDVRVTNAPATENKAKNSTIMTKDNKYPENVQNIYISCNSRNDYSDKSFKTVVFIK